MRFSSPVRFHGAYDARLHDASFYTEVLYITSLSRTLRNRASHPIPYRILFTDACTDRNLREFNPPARALFRRSARHGTRKRGAGYKLDELRSRLTPPFPHPSAKLVEFSAILPPGNLNLVPRRYLPSLYSRFTMACGRIKAAAAAPQSQMLRSWKSKGGSKSVRAEPANRSYVTM